MRVSHKWLKTFIPNLPEPDVVAQALTSIGLEVEDILRFDYLQSFSVARIQEVYQHPNADRLSVCKVETKDGLREIVCGAPNVEAGMNTAYACVGTVMPSGLKIRESKIRGVVSCGMLCSRDELGLATRTSRGIMRLEPTLTVGTDLAQALRLDGVVYDVCLTPNRSDCFGVQGLARDLSAKLNTPLVLPKTPNVPVTFDSDITITCTPEAHDACPHFLARVIRGVRNVQSPSWLQSLLRESGGAPISALVDVTNYMSFGRCRPMHVFDKRTITNGVMHLRLAKHNEPFLALDENTYTLPEGALVITDSNDNPISLAGIMGGKDSGSYEDTTDVILECAYFDPKNICKTGQKTHILSEARTRFERGVDPETARTLMDEATQLILDICGGEAGSIVEHGAPPCLSTTLSLCPQEYASHIGTPLPNTTSNLLHALGYQNDGDQWRTPSWRHDVTIKEDVFADIWRMTCDTEEGASSTPLHTTHWPLPSPTEHLSENLRQALLGLGYHETIPLMMISAHLFTLFGGKDQEPHIQNPITQELSHIRENLVSTLMLGVKHNVHHKQTPVQLYEIGPAYTNVTPEGREMRVGGIRCGPFDNHHWALKPKSADTFMVKSDVTTMILALGLDPNFLRTQSAELPKFCVPTASVKLFYKDQPLGLIGQISPTIINALMKTSQSVVFFELDLDVLLDLAHKHRRTAQDIPTHHSICRDFAFILDSAIPAQDVIDQVYTLGAPWVTNVHVFDRFIPKDTKDHTVSLGIRCIIQPKDAPLNDQQLTEISNKIIKHITETFKATLRQ